MYNIMQRLDFVGDEMSEPIEDDKEMNNAIEKFIRLREMSELRRLILKESALGEKKQSLTGKCNQLGGGIRSKIVEFEIRSHLVDNDALTFDDMDEMSDEEEDERMAMMMASDERADDDVIAHERFGGAALVKQAQWKSEMCRERAVPSWLAAWKRIDAGLVLMRNSVSIDKCLNFYTDILALHVKHEIRVDELCVKMLLNCVRADIINDLFEQNLVDGSISTKYAGLLFQTLFVTFNYRLFTSRSRQPFDIILSLAVLLYKSQCYQFRERIAQGVLNSLCNFIHRKRYKDAFAKIGMRHFLKCLILNGIYKDSHAKLTKFLSSSPSTSNRRRLAPLVRGGGEDDEEFIFIGSDEEEDDDDEDEDEDEEETSDEDVSSMDEDDDDDDDNDDDDRRHRRRRNRDRNNNNIVPFINNLNNNANQAMLFRPQQQQQQQAVEQPKTVAGLLGVNPADLSTYYPMSLKNLCRIAIKDRMIDYNRKNVQTFTVLPNALKSFLLYQDEIDAIIKVASSVQI